MMRKRAAVIRSIFILCSLGMVACSTAGPQKISESDDEVNPASQKNEPVESLPTGLPDDVNRLIERLQLCNHFAGEINGDGSERDKEVSATMSELKCDRIEADTASIRQKYAQDPVVLQMIDDAVFFSQNY